MKVVLLNPSPPGINAFGVRSLSAFLKSKGHQVVTVFFPGSLGRLKEGGGFSYRYPDKVMDQVTDLCRDADLVGVSFFTNYLDRALQLTRHVKQATDIPVIWGGIHASTKPEEALKHVDMVCIGEGEWALLELLDKMQEGAGFDNVKGIWSRGPNGTIIKPPLQPLIVDLDNLPFFDCDHEDQVVLNPKTGNLEGMTDQIVEENMPLMPDRNDRLRRTYRTMTDRGCPHHCTYCNVPTLKRLYKLDPSPYLRSRSPEHVIGELEWIRRKYPFVEAVHIFDDTFFARPFSYIEKFSRLYKEKIGLPMYCQASPTTLSEKKLCALIDAGLVYVEMGIQTGSPKIRKLYARKESNEQILEAVRLLHAYRKDLIAPDYHVILDNPWEDENETMETVRLLHQFPKPFGLAISSLVFYPRTGLYDLAVADGLIEDEMKEISLKPFYIPPKKSYVYFLIYLMTFPRFPKKLMAWLIRDDVVTAASKRNLSFLYKLIYPLGEGFRIGVKGIKAVLRGDGQRLRLYFEKIRTGDPVVAGRKGK